MRQLPLDIQLRIDAKFDNFVVGRNQLLLKFLHDLAQAPSPKMVLWHASKGSGCTHLAHALTAKAAEQKQRAVYLPLLWPNLHPDHLDGLEFCDLVVLDDVDCVSDNHDWCVALFRLYNAIKDRGGALALSAHAPAAEIKCALADWKTRLSSTTVFAIQELNDDEKAALLMRRASELGLQLGNDSATFLLNRQSRSLPELLAALEKLDAASLAEQRRLTLPFIKQVLQL